MHRPHVSTSTTTHGNMSLRFDEAEIVLQNRKNFLEENGSTWEQHICMRCNHQNDIVLVDTQSPTDSNRMIDAEVLVTQDRNLTLMLLTADCLPSTFYDPVTQTLALAHFSRETIAKELPTQLITYLNAHLNVTIENLHVFVGPHIHKQSYRFPTPLPQVSEAIKPYTAVAQDYTYIDLPAAHNAQLIAAGVPQENIFLSEVDTATSPKHFSHYQSKKENASQGRIATIARITSASV